MRKPGARDAAEAGNVVTAAATDDDARPPPSDRWRAARAGWRRHACALARSLAPPARLALSACDCRAPAATARSLAHKRQRRPRLYTAVASMASLTQPPACAHTSACATLKAVPFFLLIRPLSAATSARTHHCGALARMPTTGRHRAAPIAKLRITAALCSC